MQSVYVYVWTHHACLNSPINRIHSYLSGCCEVLVYDDVATGAVESGHLDEV